MRRGRGRIVAVAAIAVMAFAGAADGALAKKKAMRPAAAPAPGPVLTASSALTIPPFSLPFSPVTGKATCPAGTTVVGGGYSSPAESAPVSSLPFIAASRRTGLSAWQISAVTFSPSPTTIMVHVYCRASFKPLTEVSETLTLPAAASMTEPAYATGVSACPPGEKAVAGGTSTGLLGLFGTGVYESHRTASGEAWSVAIASTAESPTEVTVIVYCTPSEVYRASDAPVVTSSEFQEILTATAGGCPVIQVATPKSGKKGKKGKGKKGKRRLADSAKRRKRRKKKRVTTSPVPTQVVNGGYRLSTPLLTQPSPSAGNVLDYALAAGAWKVRTLHGGTAPSTVAAEAYCMV